MAATPPLDHHSLNDNATGPFFKQSPKVTEAPVNYLRQQLKPVWQSHTGTYWGRLGLLLLVFQAHPIPSEHMSGSTVSRTPRFSLVWF